MTGIGILGDMPPNDIQPLIVDGIHLRWNSIRELGFPWYGYFLFRRPHGPGDPVSIAHSLPQAQPDTWPDQFLNTPYGRFTSDEKLILTESFGPASTRELALSGRKHLRYDLHPSDSAFRLKVFIGFTASSTESCIVRLLSGPAILSEQKSSGDPGEIVTLLFEADKITGIEIEGAEAVLIDIWIDHISRNSNRDWEFVPGIPAPLALPVSSPLYPADPAPTDLAVSEAVGGSRIHYGDPATWLGPAFAEMHEHLKFLVEEGPSGPAMSLKSIEIFDENGVAGSGEVPSVEQYPLDLCLLAALNPAAAQLLGLYWVDRHAVENVRYDYLIAADHTGVSDGSPNVMLELVRGGDFSEIDGFIVFNIAKTAASPMDSPGDVRAYALPAAASADEDGEVVGETNCAGLRWSTAVLGSNMLRPGAAILYHTWRTWLGNSKDPNDAIAEFKPTSTNPTLAPLFPSVPDLAPTRPPDWPQFALNYIDIGLTDGWYGYRVSGIDIFGRHSKTSADAAWFQWSPEPYPRPWYYRAPANRVVHPSAVRLLDKTGPPPPAGVEAYALDPKDPTTVRDDVYTKWFTHLSPDEQENLIGLRVRWQWTQPLARQAPDAREFRVYLASGSMNSVYGKLAAVSPASPTETSVETNIQNALPSDSYAGCWLRQGSRAFSILGSSGTSPLVLRVKNIGPLDDVIPSPGNCSISIPQVYNSGTVSVHRGSAVVLGDRTNWTPNLAGMAFKIFGEPVTYRIGQVIASNQLLLDATYVGNDGIALPYGIRYPLHKDLSSPDSYDERYHVIGIDEPVDRTFDSEGRSVLHFETILPREGDGDRSGLHLPTTLAEPIRYASVGVSTADDKIHTLDDPKWVSGSWGGADRFGNEGPVGPPCKIYVVRREPPPAPSVPVDSERVYASPADYHSHSFYTLRWIPAKDLKTHIYRALDETLFRIDWARRAVDRGGLDPADTSLFPDDWDLTKRRGIADEINVLDTFDTATTRDKALRIYHGFSNDALRTLAGLRGNEAAFVQITIAALDPDDPANANRPGPDTPAGTEIDPLLRAYVDTIDGRGSNRYFYRTAYIDAVQNLGPFSLSGPPVYLPKVTPPRSPVIARVVAGDKTITVGWASNREADLAEYRIYRTPDADRTRDLRLMELLIALPADPADSRPIEVSLADRSILSPDPYFYRVTAVDSQGNESAPSVIATGKAYRLGSPEPPYDVSAVVETDSSTRRVVLRWETIEPLEVSVQRRTSNSAWSSIASWLPPDTKSIVDMPVEEGLEHFYRLRGRDLFGRQTTLSEPAAVIP